MIPDEKSRLRKLDHELYTTDIIAPNRRSTLHHQSAQSPDDWDAPAEPYHPPMTKSTDSSIFKKIFFGSLALLAVALVIAAGSFFLGAGSISSDRVNITVTTRAFVDGGEELPVDVTITNRNRSPLELTTLVLNYPSGSAAAIAGAAGTESMARISRDIGSVGVGESKTESFSIKLYGEEGSAKQITAHLEFRVAGSNVVYDRDEIASVTVRTSPIRLTLDIPGAVLPNQEVPLTFSIIGNGTATLSNVALKAEYPAGFTFNRAQPAPSTGNTIWYLGDVPPGVNRTITVYGSFAGTANDAITLRGSVGSQSPRSETVLDQIYNAVAQVIPITTAFIDAKLSVANNPQAGTSIPVGATQDVRVDIPWTNTTGAQLSNVELRVGLSGSAYDASRVQPGTGFFSSSTNEIVWTRQQTAAFASIEPGESGTVSFTITPKPGVTGEKPSITMTVSVKAVDAGMVRTAQTIDKKTLVIATDLNLLARTIHYSGPIPNTGSMPPKRDTETTYTLEWQLTNSRNRITGARVVTSLPTNVSWKNTVAPQNEAVTYNDVTRELIWNAGEISAGATKTVSIKVGVTPSSQQAGGVASLTDTMTVSGRDTFTNTDISFTKRGLDTRTQNDGTGPGAQGTVQ